MTKDERRIGDGPWTVVLWRDPSQGLLLMGLVYLGRYFPTIDKLEQ